jgi:hypothetical protein
VPPEEPESPPWDASPPTDPDELELPPELEPPDPLLDAWPLLVPPPLLPPLLPPLPPLLPFEPLDPLPCAPESPAPGSELPLQPNAVAAASAQTEAPMQILVRVVASIVTSFPLPTADHLPRGPGDAQ